MSPKSTHPHTSQRLSIFAPCLRHLARRNVSGGAVQYFLADHLGSTDVITSSTGSILKEADYFPYGGEIVISGSSSHNYKFTGKERDTESGLDNFGARYFGPSLGRFMQADPKVKSLKKMADPQQWNMYSYSRNNPTSYFDPDGREVEALTALALQRIQSTLPKDVRSQVTADKSG